MKTLIFSDEQFDAERIVKTADSITGYDATGNQLFAFRGITDFTGFTLGAGEEWDADISDTARIEAMEMALLDVLLGV
jgi:hypothetical protein